MKQSLRRHSIFYVGWILALVLPSGASSVSISRIYAIEPHNPIVIEDNTAIIWLFCILTFLVAQPLLLRYVIRKAGWWLSATIAGGFFGFLLLFLIDNLVPGPLDPFLEDVLLYSLLGLGTGVFQWFILRYSIQQAFLWIILSVVNMAYIAYVSDVLATTLVHASYDIIRPMLVGAVYGALSGGGMLWLLLTRRDATVVVPKHPLYEDVAAIIHLLLLIFFILFFIGATYGV